MSGPRVVVLGGGHGAAATLAAARTYASSVTAVVSVADDGGSSGRLRPHVHGVAVGDLRRCLLALAADPGRWEGALQHRFSGGELDGHAVGNLLLAGLIDRHDDLMVGLAEAGSLLDTVGDVFPATTEPVVLVARTAGGEVRGQAAIVQTSGVEEVWLEPANPAVPRAVLAAIEAADQILIGPGSLYTSVLAALAPPAIVDAVASTTARTIYVCNLVCGEPESEGYSVADHVAALERHGVVPDHVVCDCSLGLELGHVTVPVVHAALSAGGHPMHDPLALAGVVSPLA